MELGQASLEAQEQHAKLLDRVAAEQRGKSMIVPTDPAEVQIMLRAIGEPICYFGEGPGERRQRLQTKLGAAAVARDRGETISDELATTLGAAATGDGAAMVQALESASGGGRTLAEAKKAAEEAAALAERRKRELFYVKASEALQQARVAIAADSLARAKARLDCEAQTTRCLERLAAAESDAALPRDTASQRAIDSVARAACVLATVPRLRPVLSENAGDRPLLGLDWSGCGRALVVGGFGAVAQVWDARKLRRRAVLRGHDDRVVDCRFHPQFGGPGFDPRPGSGRVSIATASADCTAALWAAGSETPLARLRGHAGRLAAVRWLPLGGHVLTSSHDETVRLWDAGTGRCLQVQEGHHRQVHGLAVHPDGALFASGDYAGGARLWDLRSGQCVWVVGEVRRKVPVAGAVTSATAGAGAGGNGDEDGGVGPTDASLTSVPTTGGGGGRGKAAVLERIPAHATQVTCLDFHRDGWRLASGGADGAVKVWDIRACKKVMDLAGHGSVVSSVQFAPRTGAVLLSSSMDGTVRFWGSSDGAPLGRAVGHDGRVMGAAWRGTDDARVASIGYDRTLKVWAHDMDF